MVSRVKLTYLGPCAEAQRSAGRELTRPDGYQTSQRHTSMHRPVRRAPGNWLLPTGLHGNCRTRWGKFATPHQIKRLRRMIARILAMSTKLKGRLNPSDERARDVRAVREVPRLDDLSSEAEGVMRRLIAMQSPHGWRRWIHPDVPASPAKACDRRWAADGLVARA